MKSIRDGLAGIVGEQYALTGTDIADEYGRDATFIQRAPDFVVRPASTEEMSSVCALLYSHDIPITARGAGTGLSGGAVPLKGGAVIALGRLDSLDIDKTAMCAVAGAGVVTSHIDAAAAIEGLHYPPDPASFESCSIGGNIATNAGGPSCLKYGVTAEYVMGLTVVLADGRVLRLGGKARKRSAGYRLAQLFIGSEGTLGIVTEAVLRLIPLPKFTAAALIAFSSLDDAARGVAAVLGSGYLPAALELMDASALRYVSDLLPQGFPHEATAVLLLEQDGSERPAIASELQQMAEIAGSGNASALVIDLEGKHREEMWMARRAIGARLLENRAYRLSEDIAVPIPAVPAMIGRIHEISEEMGVAVAVFGHAGDGNLHPSLIFDDRQPATLAGVAEAARRIFRAAIDAGGTVSAEHGLGAIKREFASEEMGTSAVEIMKQIKSLLDPKGLLNPGKVFPTGEAFLESLPGWLE